MSTTATKDQPAFAAVDRVDHPLDRATFRDDYVLARRPVVIRAGSLGQLGWRTGEWTPDYLKHKAGNVPVIVQRRQGGVFSPAGGAGTHVRMPFDQFVGRVMEGESTDESLYLNLQGYDEKLTAPLAQLQEDFSVPDYFADATIRWINLWMGRTAEATHSQMHHDYHDNLYCVVSGRKEFVLFPPDDAPNLYTRGKALRIDPNGVIHYRPEDLKRQPHFSLINTRKVDLGRFPRYADTHPHRLSLEAGDLLFLPAGWFHEVHSEGAHIAINFWADPPGNRLIRK